MSVELIQFLMGVCLGVQIGWLLGMIAAHFIYREDK